MPDVPHAPPNKLGKLIRRWLGQPEPELAARAAEPGVAKTAAQLLVDRGSRRLAHEIGRAFAERLQLEELIPFAIARCREILDAESVAVLLYDREADELYFPYVATDDPAVATRTMQMRLPADCGIAGAVLRSGTAERVDDAARDPRFFPGVDQQMGQTTRALLCAPLVSPAGAIGVIEAVNLRGAALFTDDDLALLNTLAESLAAAIQNANASTPSAAGDELKGSGQRLDHAATAGPLKAEEANTSTAPGTEHRSQTVFRQEGEYWTVEFEGTVSRLKDAKGLHYIAYLLRHPGREFHVRELVAAVGDTPSPREVMDEAQAIGQGLHVSGLGDAGAPLDTKAKAAYKKRLDELSDELDEAERFNDPGRIARAREEMELIMDQLTAAVGLGGRDRAAASDAERARLAVTKRIKAALEKIRQANPSLARHFASAISTGYICVYAPKATTPTSWSL